MRSPEETAGARWVERATWLTALLISIALNWQWCEPPLAEDAQVYSQMGVVEVLDCASVHATSHGFVLAKHETGYLVGTRTLSTPTGEVVDTLVMQASAHENVRFETHSQLKLQVNRRFDPSVEPRDLSRIDSLETIEDAITTGCQ